MTPAPAPSDGKRERTRAKLIAAALVVVTEKGFAAASLDEIAGRAGVTKGAIYSNFAGKADLMFALAMSETTTVTYESGGALKDQLRAFAGILTDLLPEVRAKQRLQANFQLYVASEPELAKRIAAVHSDVFDKMSEAFGQAHGQSLRLPPRALVLAAQALTMGFIYQSLVTPEEITDDVVAAAFEALAAGATGSGI
jgi:AcrR family transcriptional regulator